MVRQFFGVSLFILLLISSQITFANDIKVASKITHVTIYPGAALVTRSTEINLPIGDHTILFENIIPEVNDNALTVKGQGSAEVKIFGASVKRDYLTESANSRVKDLQTKIEAVDDQLAVLQNKQNILTKQQEYLDSIKFKAGEQLPKDMQTKMPTATDLQALGEYLAKGFDDIVTQGEDVRIKTRDLQRQRDALNQELNQMQNGQQRVKRSIGVDVQCEKEGKINLMVSYLVSGVNWTPVYDARVNFDKVQVELSMYGQVSQTTGEDWQGVNLTISTSRPTVGGRMPELNSWFIIPAPVYSPGEVSEAMGVERAIGSFNKGRSVSNLKMASDKIVEKFDEPLQSSVVYAQAESKGVSVVFKVTKQVDIKSDGTWHRVPVTVMQMPISFEYATTPKLNTFAYLKSGVVNNQEGMLLPGAVSVYMDGDYVGSSSIEKAIGSKEQFDLYLGIDEGVTVKRKLLERKSDDTMFAGLPSPNRTISFSYKITVENYKSKPIDVKVYENIPVSQDDKIKIKDVKFTPDPTKKDVDDRQGVIRWSLSLNPKEKKEIFIKYTVEYSRNLNVSGL